MSQIKFSLDLVCVTGESLGNVMETKFFLFSRIRVVSIRQN